MEGMECFAITVYVSAGGAGAGPSSEDEAAAAVMCLSWAMTIGKTRF
jgi:hypothetical protein